MLETAVPNSGSTVLSQEALAEISRELQIGDKVAVVFRQPSKTRGLKTEVWHGHIVEPMEKKFKQRGVQWISYEEAGDELIFPFPPPEYLVQVLDVILLTTDHRPTTGLGGSLYANSPSQACTPSTPSCPEEWSSRRSLGWKFKRRRVADNSIELRSGGSTILTDTSSEASAAEASVRSTAATAGTPIPSRQSTNNNIDFSNYNSDFTTALKQRLYPQRKFVVSVGMQMLDEHRLFDDLDVEQKHFDIDELQEAELFVETHLNEIAAVVTTPFDIPLERTTGTQQSPPLSPLYRIGSSSAHPGHTGATKAAVHSGVSLCKFVADLRKDVTPSSPVGFTEAEKQFPLTIMACTLLPERVDLHKECDIFIHATEKVDVLAIRELSRALAPASVVWVRGTKPGPSEQLEVKISKLGFSLHTFETTYRAYQFITSCPWNICALVTDPCPEIEKMGYLSGPELARRVRHIELSRFKKPYLILLGRNTGNRDEDVFDREIQTSDNVEEEVFQSLNEARLRYVKDSSFRKGVIVFGRGAEHPLANTYPSPFDIVVDGKTYHCSTVEQFFQAAKHYGNEQLFGEILTTENFHAALKLAWQNSISSRHWDSIRYDVMLFALGKKFTTPFFSEFLRSTERRDIIHATFAAKDEYWGDGSDGALHRGRNILGKMLMLIRDDITANGNAIHQTTCPLRRVEHIVDDGDTRTYGTINTFQVLDREVLGKGAFGMVLKGRDMYDNSTVAVKVAKLRSDSAANESLENEMQKLATIKEANIVRMIYAEIPRKGQAKIYMEYMSGGSLQSLVKTSCLWEPAIRSNVQQVLLGLDALHRKYSLVHCDLKPENVLMDGKMCKISDFGASKFANAVEKEESSPGTFLYMSPERLLNPGQGSKEDDIWALGCVVVRLALGGKFHPWWRPGDSTGLPDSREQLRRSQSSPRHPYIPTHLSDRAIHFVLRCFHIDPSQRPTAIELLRDPWIQNTNIDDMESYDNYCKRTNAQAPLVESDSMNLPGVGAKSALLSADAGSPQDEIYSSQDTATMR